METCEDKHVAALRLLVTPTLPVNAPGFLVHLAEQHSKLLDGGQTSLSFPEWLWYHRGVDHVWSKEVEEIVAKMLDSPEPIKADLETLVGRFLCGGGPNGTCFTVDCSEIPFVPGESTEQLMRRFHRFVWDTRNKRSYAAELQMFVSANLSGPEKIVSPSHYGSGTYECIKVINALGMGRNFCAGNVIKYAMRAGRKDGESEADDVRKIIRYAELWLEVLEARDAEN